jgi:hypothetical protein
MLLKKSQLRVRDAVAKGLSTGTDLGGHRGPAE